MCKLSLWLEMVLCFFLEDALSVPQKERFFSLLMFIVETLKILRDGCSQHKSGRCQHCGLYPAGRSFYISIYHIKQIGKQGVWQPLSVIPALRRVKQDWHKFEARLGYIYSGDMSVCPSVCLSSVCLIYLASVCLASVCLPISVLPAPFSLSLLRKQNRIAVFLCQWMSSLSSFNPFLTSHRAVAFTVGIISLSERRAARSLWSICISLGRLTESFHSCFIGSIAGTFCMFSEWHDF